MSDYKKIGKLENVLMGGMYCGKSTELKRYATINADLGFKVVYINSVLDTRDTLYGNEVFTTHNSSGKYISTKIDLIKVEKLGDVDISKYDVITVDEFQFYKDDDPSEIIREWVLEKNKRVSVAGLDGDYKMRPFGDIFKLIPLCEAGGVRKLKDAKCMICLRDNILSMASFTKKISIKNDENTVIDVGGKDKYIAVCLKCHQIGKL